MRSPLSSLPLPFLPLLLLAVLSLFLPPVQAGDPPMHLSVERFTVLVNGSAFFVQGVCYNPASLGTAPAWTPPWGDYLQPQYADVWERDFPVMKAMGVNTVRVWQWNNDVDHGSFLDSAFRHGLKVIVTFYVGSGQFPVQLDWQRQQLLGTFRWQVQRYLHHPALLAWSFGAEMNAPWNNFLPAFSNAFGCGWSGATAPTGCFGDPLTSPDSGCHQSVACVYQHLLEFINTAAIYAKDVMGGKPSHLILGGLADVDVVTSRLGLYERFAPQVDGWAMQVYRGRDFGHGDDDFLKLYAHSSKKPLIVSEYGVDAYNDPCGDADSSPCFNFAHEPPAGYGEDQETQAEWVRPQPPRTHAYMQCAARVARGGCTAQRHRVMTSNNSQTMTDLPIFGNDERILPFSESIVVHSPPPHRCRSSTHLCPSLSMCASWPPCSWWV